MANPQTENGFIQIATGNEENDILKALVRAELSGTEYQVILLVIRQTYGFKKKEDWISLSQFQGITGKSREALCKYIKRLVNKKILVKHSTPGKNAYFSLNKNFDTWIKLVNKSRLVNNSTKTSEQKYTQLVNNSSPTKEIITKETITKENIGLNKSTKRNDLKFPKEDYDFLIRKYQELKGITLQGNEFLPIQQIIKSMFLSGRTKEVILECMEFIATSDQPYWQTWTINTIYKQLPLFLSGKLKG